MENTLPASPVNPTTLPGYYDQPEEQRTAQLLAWGAEMEQANNDRQDDSFEVIAPPPGPLGMLLFTRACTSLSDDEATARVNLVPSGTSAGWVLCTEEGMAPVPCQDKPETHRHLMWEC